MSTRDYFLGPTTIAAGTYFEFPRWPKPYRLVSLCAVLTTNAALGARVPTLQVVDPVSLTTLAKFPIQEYDVPAAVFTPANSCIAHCTWIAAGGKSYGNYGTGAAMALVTPIPDDLIIWPSMLVRYRVENANAADTTTALVMCIDQEPWRPGFYHPDLPRAKRKPRVPIRPGSAPDAEGFDG